MRACCSASAIGVTQFDFTALLGISIAALKPFESLRAALSNCRATGFACASTTSDAARTAMRTAGNARIAAQHCSSAASSSHHRSSPAIAGRQVSSRGRELHEQLPLGSSGAIRRGRCLDGRPARLTAAQRTTFVMAAGQDQQSAPDYSEFETFAHELVETAAAVTTPYFRQGPHIIEGQQRPSPFARFLTVEKVHIPWALYWRQNCRANARRRPHPANKIFPPSSSFLHFFRLQVEAGSGQQGGREPGDEGGP